MTPLQNNHESRAATRVRRSEVIHTSQKPSVSYGLLTQHSDASSQDPASTIDTIQDVFGDTGHPLHKRFQDLTKNRMKRTSLNHVLKEQQRKQSEILAPKSKLSYQEPKTLIRNQRLADFKHRNGGYNPRQDTLRSLSPTNRP